MQIRRTKNIASRFGNEVEISAPDSKVVDIYDSPDGKKGWWTRIVTSVDTWHRWVDLALKIGVSGLIFILLWKWLNFVMEAINVGNVSDAVQIALVSGSTVNLIGLLAIMARYLFPFTKK